MKTKNVALVLSSGGARGYAHIGAIEALEERGYNIVSVAGTSMGALVGGMYASGKLPQVKEFMCSLDARKVLSLTDFSLSLNHLVKGDKVMDALKAIVPDVPIENLNIPFTAIASDVQNHKEIVFDKGDLYEAIRASISIPSLFKPITGDGRILVDGGLVNSLPLNRVARTDNDILVAINVSAPATAEAEQLRKAEEKIRIKEDKVVGKVLSASPAIDSNYVTLISECISLMIEVNTDLSIKLTPPDIMAEIPMNRFNGYDYMNAEEIIHEGRVRMDEALDNYENSIELDDMPDKFEAD